MPSLPMLNPSTMINESPHVVILGAGASIASVASNPELNRRELPSMANLAKVLALEADICDATGLANVEDFEEVYDRLVQFGGHDELVGKIQDRVWHYFADLHLPAEPTIYDQLLLSLRSKDLIATFNWDPFLAQAYRRNIDFAGNRLPQIAFLHGNVALGVCMKCKTLGWFPTSCAKCGYPFSKSQLLYPVGQKDYASDPVIADQWALLRYCLQQAYFITIFGYSAPATDLEAKRLMLTEWKDNPSQTLAEIEIIDIKAKAQRHALEETWADFTHSSHYSCFEDYGFSYLMRHPRRTCDAFAMATLQQQPWADNAIPQFDTLNELHGWLKPLLVEEDRGAFSGNPLSKP